MACKQAPANGRAPAGHVGRAGPHTTWPDTESHFGRYLGGEFSGLLGPRAHSHRVWDTRILDRAKSHAVFAKDNILNHLQVGFHCPQFSGLHEPHRPDPGTQGGVRAPVSDTRLESFWLRVTTQACAPTASPPPHCCSKVAGGTEASGTRSRGRGGWGPAWQSFCKPRRSAHPVSLVWPFSSQLHSFITLTSLPYHRFLNIWCSVDIYSSFT